MDAIETVVARHVAANPHRHAAFAFDLSHAHAGAGTRPLDPVVVDRHYAATMAAVGEIAADLPKDAAPPTAVVIAHLADHARASAGLPASATFHVARTLFAATAARRAA